MSYKNLEIWNISREVTIEIQNDETTDHLETLFETGSLKNIPRYNDLHARLQILGKKVNLFIQSLDRTLVTKNKKLGQFTSNQQSATSLRQPATSYKQPETL